MNVSKLSWRWLSAELKRREVYPVIVTYAIVGWILLQIGEVTFDPLGVPEWVMPALIVLVIGVPVIDIVDSYVSINSHHTETNSS